MNLEELLQLEKHLETGFTGLLKTVCANSDSSRSIDTSSSPRIEIKCYVGEVFQRQSHLLNSGEQIYDTYNGRVELKLKTNRHTEDKSDAHHVLIGQTRAKCQQFNVRGTWKQYQDDVLVFDIREAGTDQSIVDTDDMDVTRLTFNLLFSINPASWPENL